MKKIKIFLLSLFFSTICFYFTGCGSEKFEDTLILIHGDEFVMGDNTIALPWDFYSHQEHYVTISSFYVSPFEVTQKEFENIMGYNPSFYQGNGGNKLPADGEEQDLRPVEKLNWYETIVFCNKLSREKGLNPVYSKLISSSDEDGEVYSTDTTLWGEIPTVKGSNDWNSIIWDKKANGYRLLTEAEWEYVAKGGNLDLSYNASGFNYHDKDFVKYCWAESNSNGKTHQTGILEPNGLGIYDLTGNVWEWCWDWFDENYYTTEASSGKNPSGPENGEFRCLRGSSWDDSDEELASIVRGSAAPYIPSRRGGFRIARNAK